MNWPLGSLFPSIINLFQFVDLNYPHIWWYPNWYLGLPLRFLIGPVVPFVVVLFHRITAISLEYSYLGLIIFAQMLGLVGLNLFIKELGGAKKLRLLVVVFYILWPFSSFILANANGLGQISISILPWILVCYLKSLKEQNKLKLFGKEFVTVVLVAVSLLINITSFLSVIVGLCLIVLIYSKKNNFFTNLIKLSIIFLFGLSLSLLWYTPRYFLTLLVNPSFAGWPLVNVIKFIGQILFALLPIVIGFWVTQKRIVFKNNLIKFVSLFTISFIFLTFMRFLSDPDFILDWTGYFLELQFGLVLVLGYAIYRYLNRQIVILLIILILTISDGFLIEKYFLKGFLERQNYKNEIQNLILNNKPADNERYFFSGSPVFWTNYFQVRGGKDDVSIHPTWAMGSYAIREGESDQILTDWLQIFGVSKLLVQSEASQDVFHDFKNLGRFSDFQATKKDKPDTLYVLDNSIVRIVDSRIKKVPKPKNGQDSEVVSLYVDLIKKPIPSKFISPSEIEINVSNINSWEMVSLAVAYDPGWKMVRGEGSLESDSFGNILVNIQKPGNLVLKYQEDNFGILIIIVINILVFWILLKPDFIISYVSKNLPSLNQSNINEEENY